MSCRLLTGEGGRAAVDDVDTISYVWPISNSDAAYLEGVHFRLLWHIVAKTSDEHLTRDRVLRLTDVPPMSALLCQKRLRWVGHALRRAPAEGARLNVLEKLNKLKSHWFD